MRLVVGISGATGAIFGIRLLGALSGERTASADR
jgi:3-polyprenyl-4-hydroxybenzoate decarboxylase